MKYTTQAETDVRDAALKSAYEFYGSSAGAYGFIWNAAKEFYQPKWVRIDGPEDLPKEKGKYLWQKRFEKPHPGYEELVYVAFDPTDEFDSWNYEKYVAWIKLEPYQPQEAV